MKKFILFGMVFLAALIFYSNVTFSFPHGYPTQETYDSQVDLDTAEATIVINTASISANTTNVAKKANFECDVFKEPETKWHFDWKDNFPKEIQEVIVKNHRADIRTKEGLVIELQNSSISSQQIRERENFYSNMIWILNGNTIAKNLKIGIKLREFNYKIRIFNWKWFHKSWLSAKKPIFVDMGGDTLFLIRIKNENGMGFAKKSR